MQHLVYEQEKYRVLSLPHPFALFAVLNPFTWFSEIFLGVRTPKVILIDKSLDKPLMERTFIPCLSCGQIHNSLLWGYQKNFGHWFGLVCPACGEIIPCLWNILSLLILAITWPLWHFPVVLLKEKYLNFERTRIKNPINKFSHKTFPWIKISIIATVLYFLFMVLFMQIIFHHIYLSGEINWLYLLKLAFSSAMYGFGFTSLFYIVMGLRSRQNQQNNFNQN